MSRQPVTLLPPMPRQHDVSLPTMPDDVIVTPVSLANLPQQDVSLDLPQQDVSLDLPHRVCQPNPRYFDSSFVNTTTCHPLPSTIEPQTVIQALKDPLWRQSHG
ncbi:hypothetical protein V6N11_008224 [Hibiscus sabdariffa]|uniref:Uncharacterized protein n=1 Tax=Hibiscus sabdariffa TaxID=183260 RepID=A0ABR2Q016_9ROSI